MDYLETDVLAFFDAHASAFPLYQAFASKLISEFPEAKIQVKKAKVLFPIEIYSRECLFLG